MNIGTGLTIVFLCFIALLVILLLGMPLWLS